MQATSDLYTTFGNLLQTSKVLITALERSDTLDRLLILSSLFLFLAVTAYILKKRIIDKGISLAFWWVKYLPSSSSSSAAGNARSVSNAVEKGTRIVASSLNSVAKSIETPSGPDPLTTLGLRNEL
jgi:protein transport protein SEC20